MESGGKEFKMESGGKEFNRALTQSLKEYKKKLSLNASCDAPAILKSITYFQEHFKVKMRIF